jgi:hypothetical protein
MIAIAGARQKRFVTATKYGDSQLSYAQPIASAITACLAALFITFSLAGWLPSELQSNLLQKWQPQYPDAAFTVAYQAAIDSKDMLTVSSDGRGRTSVDSGTKNVIRDYRSGKTWVCYANDKRYVYEYDCILPGDCGLKAAAQSPAVSKNSLDAGRFTFPGNRTFFKM